MVASALFSLAIVSSLFALARAEAPYPTAPVKNVYKSGSTCHIQWLKGSAAWQGMKIELMTGSNANMISLATVATGLDGSRDGVFDHVCPEVTLNAPIYFYRFTVKGEEPNYTTRFTIASSSGQTAPAPNQVQPPPDNSETPWGVGAIKSGSSSTSSNSSTITSGTKPTGSSGSITPTQSPTGTSVAPSTRTTTYVTTKTFDNDPDKTKVFTKTQVVTDTPTAQATVTTTMWIRPETQTVVTTALRFTTKYIKQTVTVTQNDVSSTTVTVSSVSTVTGGSPSSTTSSSGNNANRSAITDAKGQKSSASKRMDFPVMHLLAFVVGALATCISLLG